MQTPVFRTFSAPETKTDFEKAFRCKVDRNDRVSLVYFADHSIAVFSDMFIDSEGMLSAKDSGVWWPSVKYKKTDFTTGRTGLKKWKNKRKPGFDGAKQFKLSDKYSLPVVAGYDCDAESIGQRKMDTIRFKGVDNKDLTFLVEFSQVGQQEDFRKQMKKLNQ